MVPVINLSKLRQLQTPVDREANQVRSQAMIQRYMEAQAALEKRCAELGIPVPVMVC